MRPPISLTLSVNNQDPVPHGFLVDAYVSNVTVLVANGTTVALSGPSLLSWEANATWTFYLPDGRVVSLAGGAVALSESDYFTVNATSSHTQSLVVRLTDSDAAVTAIGAGLSFTTNMLCAPPSGGSASTSLSVSFV